MGPRRPGEISRGTRGTFQLRGINTHRRRVGDITKPTVGNIVAVLKITRIRDIRCQVASSQDGIQISRIGDPDDEPVGTLQTV